MLVIPGKRESISHKLCLAQDQVMDSRLRGNDDD